MASGNSWEEVVLQAARIVGDNPGISISPDAHRARDARSAAAREVFRLSRQAGADRTFSLAEVVTLAAKAYNAGRHRQQILVSPDTLAEIAPLGSNFAYLAGYLDEIMRAARREVILMTPFWDVATLRSLLRVAPRDCRDVEIVLLLVDAFATARPIGPVANTVQSTWAPKRLRIFVHRVSPQGMPQDYPHAKCLVVDRQAGYLGSANFTEAGMGRRFELGTTIAGPQASALGSFLEILWSTTSLFKPAWDSHHTQPDEREV